MINDLKTLFKDTWYIAQIAFWDYFTPGSKYCERKGTEVREKRLEATDND